MSVIWNLVAIRVVSRRMSFVPQAKMHTCVLFIIFINFSCEKTNYSFLTQL